MSVTPEIERLNFPTHYAYVLVQPNVKAKVFELLVTGGYTAFIERIACDWFEGQNPPKTASLLEFDVDGFIRQYQYQIQINQPYVFILRLLRGTGFVGG